jgi:hypothetical protein
MRIFSLLAVFGILVGGCAEETYPANTSPELSPVNCTDWCRLMGRCQTYGRCIGCDDNECYNENMSGVGPESECCAATTELDCQNSTNCINFGVCYLCPPIGPASPAHCSNQPNCI